MRLRISAFIVAAALAALSPLSGAQVPSTPAADAFPGWPSVIDGRAVSQLPLTTRENAFARDFPGRIGRFTDGEREYVLRWVAAPTRRLHPASDCFRGLGYKVASRPMRLSQAGAPMSCFRAAGPRDGFDVCEQVTGVAGGHWPDVSSWYWLALWSGSSTGWWSLVVATPVPREATAVPPSAPVPR